MASVIVRFQGTIEVECSNAAAKRWENDGEVAGPIERALDRIQTRLSDAVGKTDVVIIDDVELEIEEAQPDD